MERYGKSIYIDNRYNIHLALHSFATSLPKRNIFFKRTERKLQRILILYNNKLIVHNIELALRCCEFIDEYGI